MSVLNDWIVLSVNAAATWIAGETGRAVAAGAAGGLYRWLMQERRRMRDGVLAVTSGSLAALYLAPVVLAVLRAMGVDLGVSEAADRAAGFLTGLAGMSMAKVIIAAVEAWALRQAKERNDE